MVSAKTHQPCPDCGSTDALTDYGSHTFCFSCRKRTSTDESSTPSINCDLIPTELIQYEELKTRNITEVTCRKFGYGIARLNGTWVQLAPYCNSNRLVVAMKTRDINKNFRMLGNFSDSTGLFGSNVWAKGGKRLVITEGELDCLSVSQAFNNAWAVVSIGSGSTSAASLLKKNIEYIESFEEVVLWFDNDIPGQQAIEQCVSIITPGKLKVVKLLSASECKDANDMLIKEGAAAVQKHVWNAQYYRPDGIIAFSEMFERLKRYRDGEQYKGYDILYPQLSNKLRGLQKRRIHTFIAAPKIGKSTVVKEIAYDLMQRHKLKIASFAIEESVDDSALLYMSIHCNKRLNLNPKEISDEEFKRVFNEIKTNDGLYLFDHFGSLDPDNLLSKFRYMAVGLGVDFIVFDHVSIVVSGLQTENERRLIGLIQTKLRSLVQETGVGILQVAHIRKGSGSKEDPEDGGHVSPSDVLGSGDIGRLSDTLIALEGNASDGTNRRKIQVLYNRITGDAGEADTLEYNKDTGRLLRVQDAF